VKTPRTTKKLRAATRLRLVVPVDAEVVVRAAQLTIPGLRWNYQHGTVFVYPVTAR